MNRNALLFVCVPFCFCIDKKSVMIEEKMPAEGLVAEYLFDNGSATDNSGNSFNGVIKNSPSTTDRREKTNSALRFDGTTSFVTITDSSRADALNFDSNDFSISVWICTKANSTGDDTRKQNIVSKGDPYNAGYTLSMFQNRFCGFIGNTGRNGYDSADETISDSAWHHVVLRRKNGVAQLFVDTLPQHSYTYSGSVRTANDLVIGKHGKKEEGYFDGSIDNVRLYNRALSESEISRLFHDPF